MKLITKISLTASAMLFLLAQIFSIYLIYQNQSEKLFLVSENEKKAIHSALLDMEREIRVSVKEKPENNTIKNNILIFTFRKHMLENSAIYKDNEPVFNNSGYEFDRLQVWEKGEVEINEKNVKVNRKNLILFYYEYKLLDQKYDIYHTLDVTDIYERSRILMVREFVVVFFMSLAMAVLLNFLIRKITKPLEAVNEAQRQLIGSMSHELKTPLTAMKGFSETIMRVNITKEQEEKALSYIYSECGRLSRLSEKMMELTKLYEPEYGICREQVIIAELFKSVKQTVSHVLEEKKIELHLVVAPEELTLSMDRDLMTSFFINLINNAVTASPQCGNIWMEAEGQKLQVRDEGCGIPKEDVDKVKKAFYRVDKSRSRKSGNMGLGLALCEQIAKVHGASLKVESKPGQGTTVAFVYSSFTNR